MDDEYRLKVFHERDIDTLLTRLGLIEKIEKKELKCAICKKIITKENLGAIYKKKNKIIIVCDSIECLEKIEGFSDEF